MLLESKVHRRSKKTTNMPHLLLSTVTVASLYLQQLSTVAAFTIPRKPFSTARSSLHNESFEEVILEFGQVGESSEKCHGTVEATRRMILKNALSVCTSSMALMGGCLPAVGKSLSEDYRQGTAALSDTDENAPIPKEAYVKLPSGVIYADLRPGNGETAQLGSKCNIQWVLRKSNGYFVDSSEVSGGVPFIFTVGDPSGAVKGLDEGIRGMKAGGVRRILMPVSAGYVDGLEDGKPGPIPAGFGPRQQMRRVMGVRKDVPGEYIFLEVQLTRVR